MKSKKDAPGRKSFQKDKKPYSSNKAKKAKISNQDLTVIIDSHQVQLLNLNTEETPTLKTRTREKSREQKIQERKELAYRKAQEYDVLQKQFNETLELFESAIDLN